MRSSLHIIRSIAPSTGGTAVSVPELAAALSRTRRYRNCLLSFCAPGEDGAGRTVPGTELLCLPWRPQELYFGGPLRRRVDSLIRGADIVQIHGLWEAHCGVAGALARRAGVPYVVSAHGMLDPWAIRHKRWKKAPYSALFERPNLNGAACLRALTSDEVRDYRDFGARSPAFVIPNGIEIPQIGAGAFLTRFPELAGHDLVLYLSRIHKKKGIHLLCRVWARIQPSFPRARLVIAGPDYENTLPSIHRLVSRLAINGSVVFTGMLNYTLKWSALDASSAFVLPSYSEGFSVATLEAMGAGIPVIISTGCHFPEVASHGCGWLIEPVETELERALSAVLSASTVERAEMGRRGCALVRERYAWDRIGNEMANAYDWVLAGPVPELAAAYVLADPEVP